MRQVGHRRDAVAAAHARAREGAPIGGALLAPAGVAVELVQVVVEADAPPLLHVAHKHGAHRRPAVLLHCARTSGRAYIAIAHVLHAVRARSRMGMRQQQRANGQHAKRVARSLLCVGHQHTNHVGRRRARTAVRRTAHTRCSGRRYHCVRAPVGTRTCLRSAQRSRRSDGSEESPAAPCAGRRT